MLEGSTVHSIASDQSGNIWVTKGNEGMFDYVIAAKYNPPLSNTAWRLKNQELWREILL